MNNSDDNSKKSLFNYFDLKDAAKELKFDINCGSNQDKIKSGAKLFGKTAFNLGLMATKIGIEVAKSAPKIIANNLEQKIKNGEISDEQKNRAEEYINHVRSKK